MDCRVDTEMGSAWRRPDGVLQRVSEPDKRRSGTDLTTEELDLKMDFAARLTRMSNLLGVVMHMVRVDLLSSDEHQRLEQIAELARDEITQANQRLTTLNQVSDVGSPSLCIADLVRSVVERFASQLEEESIRLEEYVESSDIDMDPLAMRSLVTGIVHYAIEQLRTSPSADKCLRIEASSQPGVMQLTVMSIGPVCATSPAVLESFRPSADRAEQCLSRSIQLASELGGNLSVRSWLRGESTIQLEVPARRTR